MTTRLITPAELPSRGITLGDKQRRRLEAAGDFPRRVPISAKTYGYVEPELDAYLSRKIAERDASLVAA